MRLRVTGNNPAFAEIDDGSGWRMVPQPWEFEADRRGPALDLYLRASREKRDRESSTYWPEPKLPEPLYTLTCAKLGYDHVWIDSVEYA